MFQLTDIMDVQKDNPDIPNVMRWSENPTASFEIFPGTSSFQAIGTCRLHSKNLDLP